MTANQLAYLNYIENHRANVVREEETMRSNLAREAETNRANLAQEFHNISVLDETRRSNLERERINQDTLTETQRANRVREEQNHASITGDLAYKQALGFAARQNAEVNVGQLEETRRLNDARIPTMWIDSIAGAVDKTSSAFGKIVQGVLGLQYPFA